MRVFPVKHFCRFICYFTIFFTEILTTTAANKNKMRLKWYNRHWMLLFVFNFVESFKVLFVSISGRFWLIFFFVYSVRCGESIAQRPRIKRIFIKIAFFVPEQYVEFLHVLTVVCLNYVHLYTIWIRSILSRRTEWWRKNGKFCNIREKRASQVIKCNHLNFVISHRLRSIFFSVTKTNYFIFQMEKDIDCYGILLLFFLSPTVLCLSMYLCRIFWSFVVGKWR